MDIQPYHILLISPSSQQYHRIEQLLRGSQICQFRLHWFQGSELANVSENNKHYHAYLLDTTLEKAVFFSEQISPIPVIFITDDPLSGIEAVKQGVRDYLMFQELTIVALERSLRLSITHYQTQLKLERNQQDSLWEKQFYELAESVPVGLYRNDVNGNCIYINQECCKILDITLEECLGTGWLSRLHPDDKERVWQSWYQCFLTKSPWQDEYRFRHHNGKIVWVYAQAVFEFNDQGENTGSVGSLTDITERKKLEAKLSENEQFLQDIVSNIPDAIFRYVLHHDGSDQVVYISQGCQKLWEVKAEEVAENTQILWEMIHPDDVPEMQESVFISAQTLKDWDWQWRIITPSGKEKWLQGAGKPQGLENGDVVWTTVIVDVSDRKLSELALYESEQRFRAIFEQAAVGIVILSIDGILQKVNQTFCNFLGYESSELIGQHFSIFTHPDDIGSCDQSLQELIEDKQKNFIVKKRYFRSNGEIKWVESTVSLVRKNTKKPDYLIAIVQDIDSRVKTQHKLNYRLELETVVAKISKQLVTKNFINLQIILGQLGDIFNASRVCIHRFSQNQTKVSLFVEWCNQGVVSNMTEMQDIDTELFPWWMKQMFDKQRIIIHDIEEFPEEAIAEKQYFQNLDIKTVISVPIVDHSGELWGFIGFDRMDKTTPLSNNEAEVDTHVLRMLGEIIYVYLARIKSQQDLQESESRYRGIIEDQTELICRFSPQGILTFVNDAYCRFFNIKRQDLISRYFSSVMESIDKKDMVRTLHQCQKLTPDNPVVIKETKVKVKEKIYWLQWTTRAFFRTNGDITEFQALGQDITERKEAEQLLKESEANFRGIFEQAAIGIALVNHNGNFLSVNQHFCHFLRYSSSELLNLNFRSITFPDDLDISHQYIKKVMEEDAENYSLDKRYVAKNGEIKWGHLTIKLVRDSEKNPKHFICIIEDISKQKETQNALEKAKESAEAANLAKTQFLANMSHELRTPLNAILGFTQLMNRSAELTRKHQEYITTINRSGEHLLALINDILDLSKIESSQLELNGKNFDLYYLLDSLHKLFQPKAYKKNLELEIIIKENVPRYIKTDRLKLRSILINLLGNALKFTEEGGVKLSVKNKSNSSQISQLNLVFEVIDTGIGIASEEFDNLFQPFVQTQAGKTFTEGTGLGLAISKKFINLMGGNLNVISQLDVGTEFNFNILCEPGFIVNSTDSLPAFPVIKSMKNNESYRILLVEDLADNREVLRDYLEPIGFELKEASNGKEGIDIWKNWQPNLILMDIQMPVMNGYQAIQEIRLQESNNSVENTVKIIAVTASVFKQEQASIFEIGADDFIPKPIQEKELFTKIATHLSLSLVEENLEQAKSLQEIDPLDTKVIQGANILLVEDNPINQEVGQSLLENLGMIVTIANNGEEAINRIYDQQFDLVLMDISMPILDGLSATQRIREYPQFNNLPIIAMTAYGGTENYQSCKKVGMNDRLKKPINLEKLATLLKKWIDPKLSEQVSINLSKQNIPKISLNPKYNLQYLSSIDVEKAIKRVGEDLFLKLLMDFYEHYYQLPQSLRIDLQNNNYNEIQKVIHTIKTTASYIGANQLAKVSKNLEKVLEQQDRTSLNHAFLEFESELVKVLNNLKDFKNNVMNQLNQENKQAINNERKKISNILTLLESHIDEGNANAEDLVKELFQLITDQPVYPSLLELQRCVEELDSNNAKKILKKLQLKIS